MPVLTPISDNRLEDGPRHLVFVGATNEHNDALRKVGKEIIFPVQCTAMIDTGAQDSLIRQSKIEMLQLAQVGETTVHGVGGGSEGTQAIGFSVSLTFDGHPQPATNVLKVLAIPDDAFRPSSSDLLLGRNFLGQALLIYDGPRNLWTLAY